MVRQNSDKTYKIVQINPQDALKNKASADNYTLSSKDRIILYPLERFSSSYTFSVGGAVRNPVDKFPFDSDSSITVQKAILLSGGLKPDANGNGYIVRTNPNNIKEKIYLNFDAKEALKDPNSAANILLQPLDQVSLLSSLTYTDVYSVNSVGSLRKPNSFPYSKSLTVADVVSMSGGLEPTAYNKGYIVRTNLANPKEKTYLELDLDAALSNPSSPSNVSMLPLDQLRVLSTPTFTDAFTLAISGAVRNPGSFDYSPSLKLKDVLYMAGGLQLGAALNRIDIFRLEFNGNESTRTAVGTFEIDSTFEIVGKPDFGLEPFDQIVVRYVPEFELLRYVEIQGEVRYPGRYALLSDNERISSIIERAGGLTLEAEIEGSTLFRSEKGKGLIVADFKKVLKNAESNDNHILISNDVLTIPKKENLVTIKVTNTRATDLYGAAYLATGQINVPYRKGKRARWYIKEYALGFGENADRSRIFVQEQNGRLRRTRNLILFKITPKVRKGALVSIGTIPPEKIETPKIKKERDPFDWDKFLTKILAVAGTTATLIIASAAIK